MKKDIIVSDVETYVGEEIKEIPNIFISAFNNKEKLEILCPFMGFPWDGSSDHLHKMLVDNCIKNKIYEFKFGTLSVDIIRSKHVSHPLAEKGDSLFVFDKQKKFLGSHKKIAEIIKYLIK
jgi:hypothetical protein